MASVCSVLIKMFKIGIDSPGVWSLWDYCNLISSTLKPTLSTLQVGQAKVVKQSDKDQVLLIGAAVTLYEALEAADILAGEGINTRLIDPFTIKPIDAATIIANAKQCGGRIVTVEDHYPEGKLNLIKEKLSCSIRVYSVKFQVVYAYSPP